MGKRTKVHLAPNLAFPTSLITEVVDLIAKRGSGKTYTATKLAEEMLLVGAQVVVIDPVGNWYGLRLGANGKPADGIDIKIIGGRNGDIPIEYTAGKVVAKTIVESGISAILDVSTLTKARQRRFVTDFSLAMLEYRKRDPAAMHIFWEEAYRFMPQKMAKGSLNELIEATEELVTMGRNFGIGGTIIAQRSAQISKTVLTQASILIAMNTTGPADRKVIASWVEHNQVEMAVLQLSTLKKGEAYVWWPEEFGLKRIKVSKKQTYDASSTPKFGEKTRKRKLKAIDMDALSAAMTETIEKVRSEDPRFLKRRIAELEHQVATLESRPNKTVEIEVPSIDPDFMAAAASIAKRLTDTAKEITSLASDNGSKKKTPRRKAASGPSLPRQRVTKTTSDEMPAVTGGALRMLRALASLYPGSLTKRQVATVARMKSSGGTFGTYWGRLNRENMIEERGGRWQITSRGMAFFGDDLPRQPDTPEEKLEFWCDRLSGKAKEMLRFLFENSTEAFSRPEIAAAVALESSGGTFGTYLGSLTANNLAVKVGSSEYAVSAELLV